MAITGDLVTNLIADTTRFVSGIDRARESNTALSGSVNSIIGQLSRQQKAFETAGRSTLDWIEADKNASNESKELARNLLLQVDALKKVAAARKDLTTGPGALAAMTKPDHFGRGLARLESQRSLDTERDKAAAERDASDPFLQGMSKHKATNDPFQRGLRVMDDDAVKRQRDLDARRAAGKSGDAWREEDEANKAHADALRKHNLAVANAGREEDREARTRLNSARQNSRQLAQARRDDINVRNQLDASRNPAGGKGRSAGSRGQGILELSRGVEDFVAGSAYGGIKGGLMGASNNISQFGATFGPAGAILGGLVSTAAILGTTIAGAYDNWEAKSNRVKFELDEQKTGLTKIIDELEKLKEMREFRLNLTGDAGADALRLQGQQLNISQRSNTEEAAARQASITALRQQAGIPADMTIDDVLAARRDKLQRLQTNTVADWMPSSGAPTLRTNAGTIAHAEAIDDDTLNRWREEQKALDGVVRNGAQLSRQSRMIEEERQRRQKLEDDESEREMERGAERLRSHRRGGRGERTEWDQIGDRRERNNQRNADEKSKFESGQSWMQSRSEQLMLAGMKTDKERASYQAEKEHQESLRRSAEAERIGVMTPAEREYLDTQSEKNRDKQLRQAKYGDLQADGGTGFGSQDARSTGGMNAIMKAINYATQDKTIAELKKNGDISQEIVTAVNNVAAVIQSAPVPVVSF